jgi:uncharacterized membrane protein
LPLLLSMMMLWLLLLLFVVLMMALLFGRLQKIRSMIERSSPDISITFEFDDNYSEMSFWW